MRATLNFGPGHCPPDLFAGDVDHIIRGLKVHANHIAHARHVALEETYPRLRARVGTAPFHELAELHLRRAEVVARPLDTIGANFAALITDSAIRDLARIEWAWLEAYHSAEAPALGVEAVAALDPLTLLALRVGIHPAARLIVLDNPVASEPWDEPLSGEGPAILVTRPGADVALSRRPGVVSVAWVLIEEGCAIGDLLDALGSPETLFALIAAGALIEQRIAP
ncbi:MAG: putative DNA-binding domain-containing protein [Sphingomicrobium sp.]